MTISAQPSRVPADGTLPHPTHVPENQQGEPYLKVRGVSRTFGPVTALADVDIDIYPGQVHALLGENGAGKSTLMSIISGALAPTSGSIVVAGEEKKSLTTAEALRAGIAIVHQTPALLPDLTVTENLALSIPSTLRPSIFEMDDWVAEKLAAVGSTVLPDTKCGDLPIAERQLIEIARALAIDSRVLILDEPTAPLVQDKVDLLFERVRQVAADGVAVVYITHRIPEVRELADTMTILRDGRMRGSYDPHRLSDDEIISLIAGRDVDAVFPAKAAGPAEPGLSVEGLTGAKFHDVSFTVGRGEIVGLAGVAGNGQADVVRTLAGLEPYTGTVTWEGEKLRLRHSADAHRAGIAFMPADRAGEGVVADFSIRENAALGALGRFLRFGLIDRSREARTTAEMSRALEVKAPDDETAVGTLSGGNQQKVVLARALLSQPNLIVAEEPTQGVDAGARAEIYAQLRAAADAGMAILVLSSDALELEGLCDRVLVMSRGSVVETLTGDDVTEHKMMHAMVSATGHRTAGRADTADRSRTEPKEKRSPLRRFSGAFSPMVLFGAIVLLSLIATIQNARFLGEANVSNILLLATALGFVALGQLLVVITGGIDLSVGPLTGLILVITSFYWFDGASAGTLVAGVLLAAAAAAVVGLVNGTLVRGLRFTAVAATLVTYIAIQGVSLLLRPEIDGYIDFAILDVINYSIGPVPVAFLLAVAIAIGLGLLLRYWQPGIALRASGSDETIAARVGVPVGVVVGAAYVGCALLTMLGGFMLVGQVGVGDPNQGIGFTLTSITAVVVAGTLLRGGSGSPVAVLLGVLLLQVVLAMANFLRLSTAWQYWLQGGIVILAAICYVALQRRRSRLAD
ncbi:ATP-binding cassette domain-containing protein [Saccharomonospora azurea]|uniref:ATP-binding cassette domain-containing protein n=1 Tax=Saccharomonospora azurea TaxID=40988 RepID=UPI00332CBE2F